MDDLISDLLLDVMTPVAIDVIRKSLKDLGILDFIPEAKTIYNDKFVPVKF